MAVSFLMYVIEAVIVRGGENSLSKNAIERLFGII